MRHGNVQNFKMWLYYKWNRFVWLKIISYKFLFLREAIVSMVVNCWHGPYPWKVNLTCCCLSFWIYVFCGHFLWALVQFGETGMGWDCKRYVSYKRKFVSFWLSLNYSENWSPSRNLSNQSCQYRAKFCQLESAPFFSLLMIHTFYSTHFIQVCSQ